MQIGKAIQGAMNDQIHKELESAYLYLAMSAYFSGTNHPGAASWMRAQAREEVGHAMKFTDFVGTGAAASLRASPPATLPRRSRSRAAAARAVVSASINALFELASEKDYRPSAAAVVHHRAGGGGEDQPSRHLRLIGTNTSGLYMFDRELGRRAAG
jgi:ferritin